MSTSSSSRRGVLISTAAAAAVLLAAAAGQVWSRSGSAWLWLLAVALGATVVLDGAWSWWVMRRVELAVVIGPGAVAGRPTELELEVRAPRAPLRVRLAAVHDAGGRSLGAMSPTVGVQRADRGRLRCSVLERGLATSLRFDVVCTAPLGLVGTRRVVLVTLDKALAVAPEPWPHPVATPALARHRVEPRAGRATELTRGVRALVPGDGLRIVHWPATARTGRLMVREFDAPHEAVLRVVVDLGPDDGPRAEEVARRAARWLSDQLAAGVVLEVVTRTVAGIEAGPVATARVVGDRLAAATAGPVPDDAAGPDTVRFDSSSAGMAP